MTTPPTPRTAGDALGLGLRLRKARQDAGLTLRELGRRLGVSPSFLSQMETGKSQPSVATLYSLTQMLDISIDRLFEAEPGELSREPLADTADAAEAHPDPLEETADAAQVLSEYPVIPDDASTVDPPVVSRSDLGSLHRMWDGGSTQSRLSVTTPGNRTRLVMDNGVIWEQLAKNTAGHADFIEITYPPGSSSTSDERMLRHDGYEYGYLTEGELEVTLGFDVFILRTGDALGLNSAIPHLFRNQGLVPAKGIWFVHHRHD